MVKFIDNNALIYIFAKIKGAFVAKEAGKGLSTNDFTNDLKSKLEGVEATAQVNKLESVKVNGTAATITEKSVDITVPTKVSELTNDSKYLSQVSEANLDAALAEKVNAASEGNHSHANKALLDTYNQTNDNIADAVAKKHEHANKTELDLIASGDKAKWDQAVTDIASEITRAKGEEAKNATAAANAQTAADNAQDAAEAAQATADEAKTAAGTAQGEIDALEAKVGTVPTGKTVVQMISDAQTAATYDDTKVKEDIAANTAAINGVKADYLTSADKTELTGAIATAKQEAIEAVLDGVSEDYDTLKEVAAWIASDTTNSTELINRVSAIEKDYVKASEMVAITNAEIDAAFDAA